MIKFIIFILILHGGLFAQNPNYVFNLTGGFHGFGDVTGPFWTMLGLKKLKPDANYVVIVDDYSTKALRTIYGTDLEQIAHEFGVSIYTEQSFPTGMTADVSFELFFGGRKIKRYEKSQGIDYPNFYNPKFCEPNTIILVSDTMHGSTLDEVLGPGFRFYFRPPGIGSERSGIMESSNLVRFAGKPMGVQKLIAASSFSDKFLKRLITGEIDSNAEFGFIYGVHNEAQKDFLIGQSSEYLAMLEEKYPNRPLIVVSPNSKEQLQKVLSKFDRIFNLEQFKQLKHLQNKVYGVSVGKLTDFQFISLMAIATLPIVVEGDSAVSTAIRLYKEFLMYKSPWNSPAIKDLQKVDGEDAGSWVYSDVYDDQKESRPIFKHYFRKQNGRLIFARYDLSSHVADFPTKLAHVIDIAELLKSRKNHDDLSLAQQIARKTHDPYLEYSVLLDLGKRGVLSAVDLERERDALLAQGFDWTKAEERFFPNKPGFSEKIEFLSKEKTDHPISWLPEFRIPQLPHRLLEQAKVWLETHLWPSKG